MMILTVQQTAQTVTVQPQFPASAESRTPHVNPGVIVVLLFVKMAGVLLDEGRFQYIDIKWYFSNLLLTRVTRKSYPFYFFPAR
ncbi:hypothetical protein KKHLCK_13525 [Candidatus Electrothrix laxa]